MLVSSTSLGVGKGDPEGDVALLAREWGRDESKELDEELVLNDGLAASQGWSPLAQR